MRVRHGLVVSAGLFGLASACGDPAVLVVGQGGAATTDTSAATMTTGQAGNGGDPAVTIGVGPASVGGGGMGGEPPGPACGDGMLDPGEACDDGNGVSGDGCTANCDAVEANWVCPVPGEACVFTVVCGDAKISGNETCDDANTDPGDGCSDTCMVEPGWVCLVVGAACQAAMCGDGLRVGDELCDDGNADAGDGCSPTCQLEPGFVCPVPNQPCIPTVCGDGIAEGSEQCDDANNDLGDGCTPFCVNEPDCTNGPCTSVCGDGIKLPNSNEECEDGNTQAGDGCSPTCTIEPGYECVDNTAVPNQLDLPIVLRDFMISHPDFEGAIATEKNIVGTTLGADGKPVYTAPANSPTTSGQANFDQWYRDTAGVNMTILQTLTLAQQGAVYQFNDNTFFPIDGQGFGNQGNPNNFHFTSEVRYWFEYQGGEQLAFTGDDDVWVFINKQRVIDLGGVHSAQSASVALDSVAAAINLQIGSIYEAVVFQAERHTTQSNYQLTLAGFVNQVSTCNPVCGDGIKTPDEACDEGAANNDGSYGSCTPDCQLGPYCGDGILQDPPEECDDGVNLQPYGGCAPGCVNGGFCGDGVVDSLFGEECDDGSNDGGYGECAEGCVLGERCGDGVVQPTEEECDDGNKVNGDGCDNDCTSSAPN